MRMEGEHRFDVDAHRLLRRIAHFRIGVRFLLDPTARRSSRSANSRCTGSCALVWSVTASGLTPRLHQLGQDFRRVAEQAIDFASPAAVYLAMRASASSRSWPARRRSACAGGNRCGSAGIRY
jgi:hypothetical protein